MRNKQHAQRKAAAKRKELSRFKDGLGYTRVRGYRP